MLGMIFEKKLRSFSLSLLPKSKSQYKKNVFFNIEEKKICPDCCTQKNWKIVHKTKKCIVSNLTLELFCDMCEIWTPILIIQRRKSYKKNLPFLLHFFLLKRQLKNWCFTKKKFLKTTFLFSLFSPPKKLKKRKHHHQKILILTKKKIQTWYKFSILLKKFSYLPKEMYNFF